MSYNAWLYVYDNPVKYTDPSGYCAMYDLDCINAAKDLYEKYGWLIIDRKTLHEVNKLHDAAKEIESWFDRHGSNGQARMRAHMAPVNIMDSGVLFTMLGYHHVFGSSVYFLDDPTENLIIHEMGHILDNFNGSNILASVFGGGPSDEMLMSVMPGLSPGLCMPRFNCPQYRKYIEILDVERPPSDYSYQGPSEDFAETFKFSVIDPSKLPPKRAAWMDKFGSSLTNTRPIFDRDAVIGAFVPIPIPECSMPDINPQP